MSPSARDLNRRAYDPLGWLLAALSMWFFRARAERVGPPDAHLVQPTPLVPPGMHAWTVGHWILARGPLDDRLRRHELCHVRQFEVYGFTFPFRYYWSSLRTLSYRRNRFEIEARMAEADEG